MAAELNVDMNYAIMTISSQIIYKPSDQNQDPEPDNDHEVYVGNLPLYYTIEKFINFSKKPGPIYSVRLLKGNGGLNKGFGYIMYRNLATVDIAIDMYNGILLNESDINKPLIVQKSLRNTIMMIYGLSQRISIKQFIKQEINLFVLNHPSLLLKFECEDDSKIFLSFKSLKAAQIFKKKLKESFSRYGVKMYYFNDTENWH
ncbi:probable RNA-binding protein 46 isoform X2 [Daktulosphaira vitifoliae]|uniref:probable RNA-binding protein 46 isoform X2 n=1 Tax=Daktulosphaira vitifoliae TaxID=58002 RepID=UPI0021A98C2D|nr:probable RNA-binding protein 46 isoform X2 [Daktulosphaira vitifoliae]